MDPIWRPDPGARASITSFTRPAESRVGRSMARDTADDPALLDVYARLATVTAH
ncbi:hypothetical protein [Actinoplanes sp. NPDC026619]|uniref:hypothetical protein n=1 Tax=Actinoplanes sp. NPDC026619 TaxID=3155798 RepID=UPI0033CB3E59